MTFENIEQQAAEWLVRRSRPDWSGSEEAQFETWLGSSTAHRVAYLRLESVWNRADRLASLRKPETAGTFAQSVRRRRGIVAACILASVVIVGAAALLVGRLPPTQSYATEVGGHRVVSLGDGSRVELNTGTRLRVSVSGKQRTAWLDDGEAYFEVARSDQLPFLVYAGDQHVKVLGTKFSIRKDDDEVKVGVVEGRIEVRGAAEQQVVPPHVIHTGDLLIAKGRSTLVASNAMDRITAGLSWRHGMLVFNDTMLADALVEFNRYNDKKLAVVDDLAAVRIGGSFDATNESGFVQLLQQGFGLKVRDEGGRYLISN